MTSRLRVLGPRYRLRVLELWDRDGPDARSGRRRFGLGPSGRYILKFFIDLYKLTYIIKK